MHYLPGYLRRFRIAPVFRKLRLHGTSHSWQEIQRIGAEEQPVTDPASKHVLDGNLSVSSTISPRWTYEKQTPGTNSYSTVALSGSPLTVEVPINQ